MNTGALIIIAIGVLLLWALLTGRLQSFVEAFKATFSSSADPAA